MNLFKKLAPAYCLVLALMITATIFGDRAVTAFAEISDRDNRYVYIIDAGHGGIDGGATSCTGVLESQINLQIALRLNDLMRLLGHKTLMIRTTDMSVYTSGDTIAAQKVSDLKQRVRIVNEQHNGILISIHQNTFPDSKYCGAQVFSASDTASREVAVKLQSELVRVLNPGSNRKSKTGEGIYLMEHITQPGVLVECGFLSNAAEEANLRSKEYQLRLCSVIAATIPSHFREGE